jgi:hypothetical protein
MPAEAVGERFLELSDRGAERELRERLERIRSERGAPPGDELGDRSHKREDDRD